jgi:DDE family transposase
MLHVPGVMVDQKKSKHATKSDYAKGSHAEQRVRFAKQKKTEIAIQMIKRAFQRRIPINYILWDSWYNSSYSIKYAAEIVKDKGVNLISMLKRGNNKYKYNGKFYTLKELSKFAGKWVENKSTGIKSKSLIVAYVDATSAKSFKERTVIMNVKICFYIYPKVRRWRAILSTDQKLSAEEVLKIYLRRWSIECLFKEIKQYFGYNQSQSSNYVAMVADLSIRYAFYIMFCKKREEENQKPMLQILMEFYDEVFDEWLDNYIERVLRENMVKLIDYALKIGITDVRELQLKLDDVLDKFFNEVFYPDKIEEMDKPKKRKAA